MFFKEAQASLAHEARLIEILGRRRPELVTEVAFSDEHGRMLMPDAGEQLGVVLERDRDIRYWIEALPLYAELQIDAAPDADEFRAAGAFDRRSSVLSAVYAELIAERTEGLTREEYDRLLSLAPEVESACEQLGAGRVPETINNDDFTGGSIFVRDGGYRFLDWGDACVSHPFMTLTVTLRVVEIAHRLPPHSPEVERVRDAYLEPFTIFEPRETLVELATTARRFGQISRAALSVENPFWDDPDAAAWRLRLLLDSEAWRDWLDSPVS